MAVHTLLTLLGYGILSSGTLMLPAVGMSLMYDSSKFLNFAYGDFMTLAAFLTYSLTAIAPLYLAIAGGMFALALIGVATERVLFTPIAQRGHMVLLVTSLGLSYVISNLIPTIWGPQNRQMSIPSSWTTGVVLGDFQGTRIELSILAAALAITAGVGTFLKVTQLGMRIRAVAEHPDLASATGISVRRVRSTTWAISCSLAALGGVLYAFTAEFSYHLGFILLLAVASSVILGGVGSLRGALLGSLLVGTLTELSTYWIDPALKSGVPMVILAVVLLIKPSGLFGEATPW